MSYASTASLSIMQKHKVFLFMRTILLFALGLLLAPGVAAQTDNYPPIR